MLKNRVIPCLDVKDGRVVKGINFNNLIDAGDPVAQAKKYDNDGADELCFLDITASDHDRNLLYDTISNVAEHCFMPLTVGGGVKKIEDIRNLLLSGADKIAINSAAIYRPAFVREAANMFGSQCIVVSIDAKFNKQTNKYEIFTHGGKKATNINAIEWAKQMEEYGAGELLLTSMDRDGTQNGFDIEYTKAISNIVDIPTIASGGIGTLEHFVEGVEDGGATGVLAASVFHYGTFSIGQVKQYMHDNGIPVRLCNK
ncbi:MAG: imidazole glycerol phosphate synthase subunit HisF [Pseudomonadota bacterium]